MTNTESAHGIHLSQNEERTWASIAHLSALVNLVGVPSFLGPLVVWLIKKNESDFVAEEAKASLNFALSIWIYGAILLVLGVLGFLGSIDTGFTLALLLILAWSIIILLNMVFSVIGAVKASRGEPYEYPFNIRLVK